MHGAAHALHHPAPHPAPPRPAINVDEGAPIVAPSTQFKSAGASGEIDVADDGTHAADGVAASEWLAANLGGGGVAAGGTGARISATDDAQSDDNDDDEVSGLEAILGRQVGQHEDTTCDNSHCFWQASDSMCTTVLTVTLFTKKNRASRGFFVVTSTTNLKMIWKQVTNKQT